MKKIVKFDTAEGSRNLGDYIIQEAINKELSFILKKNYCVSFATHTPIAHFYQVKSGLPIIEFCESADYKFIYGTNLLSVNLLKRINTFNVNLFNYKPYKNSILVGCGLNPNSKNINIYTKLLYKRMLSKDYIHSVRDESTKRFIESLGFKALNTGCPTLWGLTPDVCKKIKKAKSENVVFTLTDYRIDRYKDQQLIDILQKNYNEIYFWVQGSKDLDYFKTLNNTSNIKIISPDLESYKEVLNDKNVDYIGTRLHAGIYALQHGVRSIILIVDNRARDMNETYNLPSMERENINHLDDLINSEFTTSIKLDFDNIERFKKQFEEFQNEL